MEQKRFETDLIIQVPFYHIDPMNVVWHGRYLEYFEVARAQLLAEFNYGYFEMKASGFSWPVVDVHVRYIKSVFLNQKIKVKAWITEYDLRLKVKFLITDAETGERLAKGHTIQVAVDEKTKTLCFGLPSIFYEKLGIEQ